MAYSNNYRYYSVKIRGMILQVEPKQYLTQLTIVFSP